MNLITLKLTELALVIWEPGPRELLNEISEVLKSIVHAENYWIITKLYSQGKT